MKLRIATFNVENLDDKEGEQPTLEERIPFFQPQLQRMDADIICFQEVHGQEHPGQPRSLTALKKVLEGTNYSDFHVVSTQTTKNEVYNERNLVVASRFDVLETKQLSQDLIPKPLYNVITEKPDDENPKPIVWERPIFYAKISVRDDFVIHLINLHLKSRRPSNIAGQKVNNYTWKSSPGWAEGYFLSSMKRVGQALETRIFIDQIFDEDENAKIVVCGDFNAHPDEVPVETIAGRVENTGNKDLALRALVSCEHSIPESARFSYLHYGKKRLLDHMLISQSLLPYYNKSEIHNEMLHDESLAFAFDTKYPESDHAPFIAEFEV
jgi:endonuclease/exonuclease/phosphatase family metal-dependent hydrolase